MPKAENHAKTAGGRAPTRQERKTNTPQEGLVGSARCDCRYANVDSIIGRPPCGRPPIPMGVTMKKTLLATAMLSALGASFSAQAAQFGIYDPRSLGMGGVGVTTATARNANFFNPAALAATKDDEDFALGLPIVAARVSDQDKLLDDIDDLETRGDALSNALNTFNATPNTPTATATQTALRDFNAILSKVNNKVLDANVFAGAILAIPSKKVGVGLHVSGRADFGAKLNYQDATFFNTIDAELGNCIADNTTCGAAQTTINANRDADGNLRWNSQLQLRGMTVSEVGVAFARRFNDWGGVDIGLTPKIQKIKTLDKLINAQSAEIDVDQDVKEENAFNFDVGVTKVYGDSMKAGLVVKNVLNKEFTTILGNKIDMKPQARLGVSHHTNWTTVGLDVDLTKNKPIAPGFDKETQFLGIGAELDVWLLQLRVGYRHDLAGNYDGIPSVGLGLNLFGLHLDAAVAGNDKEAAASVQLGLNF
jgi:hypothetical protein